MSRDTARELKVIGRRLGSKPEWWYGTFHPVQRSEWVAIDVLDEGQWVRVFRDGELAEQVAKRATSQMERSRAYEISPRKGRGNIR